MAACLRVRKVLSEDPTLVFSTHMASHNYL